MLDWWEKNFATCELGDRRFRIENQNRSYQKMKPQHRRKNGLQQHKLQPENAQEMT